jgi:hypothetical protein
VPWVVDEVDMATGEVTEVVHEKARYRTWSCSRRWGLTMRAIRQADLEKWILSQSERAAAAEMVAMSELSSAFGALATVPDDPVP